MLADTACVATTMISQPPLMLLTKLGLLAAIMAAARNRYSSSNQLTAPTAVSAAAIAGNSTTVTHWLASTSVPADSVMKPGPRAGLRKSRSMSWGQEQQPCPDAHIDAQQSPCQPRHAVQMQVDGHNARRHDDGKAAGAEMSHPQGQIVQ